MKEIVIYAPAKVNLFLKVLKRRPDGYHDIETLFEKINIFDRISLRKAPKGIAISSDNKNLPLGADNLAYRAVRNLEKRLNTALGVKMAIKKFIPIASGLGGGSSDAAAALGGINKLYDLGLSDKDLEESAKELGADVPLFIKDEVYALGSSRGDNIEGVKSSLKMWHLLVVPAITISSREAYEWVDSRRDKKGPAIDDITGAIKRNDIDRVGKNLYNDLAGLSFEKESALKDIREKMINYGAKGSMVTGSGPVLFAIAEDKKGVIEIKKRIEKDMHRVDKNWQVLVASTLTAN